MNVSQSIDATWTAVVGTSRSAVACLSGRGGTLECQQIWRVLIAAILVFAAVAVLLIARHFIRDYLRHRAALKRWQADRIVASEEEFAKVKWRGDQAETEKRTQRELAAEIKQALQKNKDGGNQT